MSKRKIATERIERNLTTHKEPVHLRRVDLSGRRQPRRSRPLGGGRRIREWVEILFLDDPSVNYTKIKNVRNISKKTKPEYHSRSLITSGLGHFLVGWGTRKKHPVSHRIAFKLPSNFGIGQAFVFCLFLFFNHNFCSLTISRHHLWIVGKRKSHNNSDGSKLTLMLSAVIKFFGRKGAGGRSRAVLYGGLFTQKKKKKNQRGNFSRKDSPLFVLTSECWASRPPPVSSTRRDLLARSCESSSYRN